MESLAARQARHSNCFKEKVLVPCPDRRRSQFKVLLMYDNSMNHHEEFLIFEFLPILSVSLIPMYRDFVPDTGSTEGRCLLQEVTFGPVRNDVSLFVHWTAIDV